MFSQSTLPLDEDLLERLFGDEVRAGAITDARSIFSDVWKNSYSASTNHKVWAAKFTARHPNLVALEMSSFKCGHDAPIYTRIESIIEQSGTPYFSFKDIDENKPTGSIRIRVETIHYFLKRYTEDLKRRRHAGTDREAHLAAYEREIAGAVAAGARIRGAGRAQQASVRRGRLLPMLGAEQQAPPGRTQHAAQ